MPTKPDNWSHINSLECAASKSAPVAVKTTAFEVTTDSPSAVLVAECGGRGHAERGRHLSQGRLHRLFERDLQQLLGFGERLHDPRDGGRAGLPGSPADLPSGEHRGRQRVDRGLVALGARGGLLGRPQGPERGRPGGGIR